MKKKGFKSIQSRFLAIILPAITFIIIILASIIFQQNYTLKEKEVKKYLVQIADARAQQIGEMFNEYKKDLEWLATREVEATMDWSLISSGHASIEKKRENIFGTVGLIRPDGRFYINKANGLAKKSLKGRDFHNAIFNQGVSYFFSEPYSAAATGKPIVTIALAVKDSSMKTVGAVGAAVNLNLVSDITSKIHIGKTGYGWIIDNKGVVCAHPDTSKLMKFNYLESSRQGYENLDEVTRDILVKGFGTGIIKTPEDKEELLVYSRIPNTPNWTLGISVDTKEVYSDIRTQFLYLVLMFMVTLLVIGVLIWYISKLKIRQPLANLIEYVKAVSDGKLYVTTNIESQDEIGQMAKALAKMLTKLKEVTKKIHETANIITINSEEMKSAATLIAQGTNEQAASSEQVASSTEEMLASISMNSELSVDIERSESKAAHDIDNAEKAVSNILKEFSAIAKRIQFITDIAQKTDLLAINAAVEAARAGQEGKGFSVVASEVRKLAEMTKQVAEEISETSTESILSSNQSGLMLREVVPLIKENASKMSGIKAASMEQKLSAEQVNEAINELTKVINSNAASTEQMAAKSNELNVLSENLKSLISYFQLNDAA